MTASLYSIATRAARPLAFVLLINAQIGAQTFDASTTCGRASMIATKGHPEKARLGIGEPSSLWHPDEVRMAATCLTFIPAGYVPPEIKPHYE